MYIGIVGASGVVGKELLNILVSNEYTTIKICASDSSIDKIIIPEMGCDMVFKFEKLEKDFFSDLDVVFFCADNEISKQWVPIALDNDVFVIDNSSHFRLDNDVHLVIPEINGKHVATSKIIANPNCCTAILCTVLYPLTKFNKIKRIDVSTYQAVSGAGKLGTEELELQCKQFVEKQEIKNNTDVFKSQIFNNCFSHNTTIDPATGYCGEELKIINETKKILGYDVDISATCIRVPIMRAHSESVKIVFEEPTSEEIIKKILNDAKGVKILDDRENNVFPEPLFATHKSDVFVGRIRKDYSDSTNTVFHMFICGDQLLKGAALNAYQIFKEYEEFHDFELVETTTKKSSKS